MRVVVDGYKKVFSTIFTSFAQRSPDNSSQCSRINQSNLNNIVKYILLLVMPSFVLFKSDVLGFCRFAPASEIHVFEHS